MHADILQKIKEGIQGHPVDWYSDVFDIVFPDVNKEVVNGLWKEQLKEPEKKKKKAKEEDDDDDD